MEEYKGYQMVFMKNEELSKFYEGLFTPESFRLKNNEYLILTDEEGNDIDYYCNDNGEFRKVNYVTIGNDFTGIMKPRPSTGQSMRRVCP